MASVFGPIECHHLVSFYRKKVDGLLGSVTAPLKKTKLRSVAVYPNLTYDVRVNLSATAVKPTKRQSAIFGYEPKLVLKFDTSLEKLLRRGLGYRIIFNMGRKDCLNLGESGWPDTTLVLTDLLGENETGRFSITGRGLALVHRSAFISLIGADTLEVSFNLRKKVITRDGKVELEFFHFDKLLSPEQLKIYNKYASVLGGYITIDTPPGDEEKDYAFEQCLNKLMDYILGLGLCTTGAHNNPALLKEMHTKLRKILELFQKHILLELDCPESNSYISRMRQITGKILESLDPEPVSEIVSHLTNKLDDCLSWYLHLRSSSQLKKKVLENMKTLEKADQQLLKNTFCSFTRSYCMDLLLREVVTDKPQDFQNENITCETKEFVFSKSSRHFLLQSKANLGHQAVWVPASTLWNVKRLKVLPKNQVLLISRTQVRVLDLEKLYEMLQNGMFENPSGIESEVPLPAVEMPHPPESKIYRNLTGWSLKVVTQRHILLLCNETGYREARFVLYLKGLLPDVLTSSWVSLVIPNRIFRVVYSLRINPGSMYQSEKSKAVFFTMRWRTSEKNLGWLLVCCGFSSATRSLRFLGSTAILPDAANPHIAGSTSQFWTEVNGRVFSYIVQTEPSVKLRISCFQRGSFVHLGTNGGGYSVSPQIECFRVCEADSLDPVGYVFKDKDYVVSAGKSYARFFLLVPSC